MYLTDPNFFADDADDAGEWEPCWRPDRVAKAVVAVAIGFAAWWAWKGIGSI